MRPERVGMAVAHLVISLEPLDELHVALERARPDQRLPFREGRPYFFSIDGK
jgi:hypothetical protein